MTTTEPPAAQSGTGEGNGAVPAEGAQPDSVAGPERSMSSAKRAVRVRCEDCGPRVVTLSAVRLLGKAAGWEYLFTCPGCGSRVRRRADEALRTALRGAGAAELSLYGPDSVPGP